MTAWCGTYKGQIDTLATLLSLEQGKSIGLATFEAQSVLQWFEEMPKMEPKESTVIDDDVRKVVKRYAPLGVCAGIVPWNFPITLMICAWPA